MNLLARIRVFVGLQSPRRVRLAIDAALVLLLFWTTHAVFKHSTGHAQNCDSVYSLAVSEKLLTDGTVKLDVCAPAGTEMPYQLIHRGDAVYYGYPLGSSILSVPFVKFAALDRGLSVFRTDGRLNGPMETLLQLKLAGNLSAIIVVIFYLLCRFHCSPAVSAAIALGFAFGSPVWSTLSRALWSHTWMVLLLCAALLLLQWRRRMESTWRTDLACGLALGTLSFWVLFTRAHGVFSILGIGVYLLLHHRRLLVITGVAGAAGVAAFVLISLHVFGTPTPPSTYSADTIDGHDVLNRFAWLMVSPSRGLLVYCPYVAVLGVILIGWRKHLADTGLVLPAAVAIGSHTLLFSCYNGWHMGSSYGPRYFADLLPWFVLLTALAVQAVLAAPIPKWRSRAVLAALALAFAWGIFAHARGANSVKAWFFNWRPIAVDFEPAVKDWRHPQFLAGLTFEVKPDGSIIEK